MTKGRITKETRDGEEAKSYTVVRYKSPPLWSGFPKHFVGLSDSNYLIASEQYMGRDHNSNSNTFVNFRLLKVKQ